MLSLSGLRPTEWVDHALCAQVDPEIFFPERGQDCGTETLRCRFEFTRCRACEARSVCHDCPVILQCRSFALNSPLFVDGIWGGLSTQARSDYRASRRLPLQHRDNPSPIRERCGSEAGARQHYRRGEKPCPACLQANRVIRSERKDRYSRRELSR